MKMSPKTSLQLNERISVLETKLELIAGENYRRFDGIEETLKEFIESAEKKYATKEEVAGIDNKVEKMSDKIWWAIAGSITGLITIVISLITYIWNLKGI